MFICLFVFEAGYLCSPGCSGTHYIDEVGLKVMDIPPGLCLLRARMRNSLFIKQRLIVAPTEIIYVTSEVYTERVATNLEGMGEAVSLSVIKILF